MLIEQYAPEELVVTSLQTIVPLPELLVVTEQLEEVEVDVDVVVPPEDELEDELEDVTVQLLLVDEEEEEEDDVDGQLLSETLSIEHITSDPPEPVLGRSSQTLFIFPVPILT